MWAMLRNLAVLGACLAANPALACQPPAMPAAASRPIDPARPDQALFAAALVAELGRWRCAQGRAPLVLSERLARVAAAHAGAQARARRLSHRLGVAGQRSLRARLRASGERFRTGAENLAAIDRFAFGAGPFGVIDAARCRFATAAGRPIPAHSHASLAAAVVAGWAGSAGHRANMLNARLTRAGAGLAFDAKAANCGRFYITLLMAG